jgi:outer membrane protein assembly factor BamB
MNNWTIRFFVAVLWMGLFWLPAAAQVQNVAQVGPGIPFNAQDLDVDPVTGNIAVSIITPNPTQNSEIAVYNPQGELLSRFQTAFFASAMAWVPDSKLVTSLQYPNRGKPPLFYSQDGQNVGQFPKPTHLLPMFRKPFGWMGNDHTPGAIVVDAKGNMYMSNTWADEDFFAPGQVAPTPALRKDHGEGARVQVYDANGNFVKNIGSGWGKDPGQMIQPTAMSFNGDCSVLAVDNKNGIDLYNADSGAYQSRITGYHLAAHARAPFLVVTDNKRQVLRIDFDGKILSTYAPIQEPTVKGFAQPDGTLLLPGGPGRTVFRRYAPDGQLIMARGDPFKLISLYAMDPHASPGMAFPLQIQALDGASYYQNGASMSASPNLHAWVRPVLEDNAWQAVTLRPVPDGDKTLIKNNALPGQAFFCDLPANLSGPQILQISQSKTPAGDDPGPEIHLIVPSVANGTATLFTSFNRRNYQAGEEIIAHLVVQAKTPVDADANVALIDASNNQTITSGKVHVTASPKNPATINLVLPSSTTKLLPPGDYWLASQVTGLESHSSKISITSPIATNEALLPLVWDSGFYDKDWIYPFARDEFAAWLGFNTIIRMENRNYLPTQTQAGVSELLKNDDGLPADESAFAETGDKGFLDRGLKTGVGLMPEIAFGWENFQIQRDAGLLDSDDRTIRLMAQLYGSYPDFRGFNDNGTNFFEPSPRDRTFSASYLATGALLPDAKQWDALFLSPLSDVETASMSAYFQYCVDLYTTDYKAWLASITDIAPGRPITGTLISGDVITDWPPALEPYLDITQSYQQSEQIQPIYDILVSDTWGSVPWKPHLSTFENFEETGTGERLDAEVAQAMLTGSWPGVVSPQIAGEPERDRSSNTKRGMPYVHREFFLRQALVAPLLTTARLADSIGILVTREQAVPQMFIQGGNFMGQPTVWTRFYSACVLCEMAHRPARVLFGEHLVDGKGMEGLKAILLTGETVALTDAEQRALAAFQAKGGIVITDAETTVAVPGARQLPVSTYAIPGFGHNAEYNVFQTDGTWQVIPEMLKARVPDFAAALDKIVPSTISADNPEVFLALYNAGQATYVAVVNTRRPSLPGIQYAKVAARYASVMPVVSRVQVPAGTALVYDLFRRAYLPLDDGKVTVDLRSHASTVLACLPVKPSLKMTLPATCHVGDKITCGLQVVDPQGSPLKAAIPFILDLRSSDGRLLARRIGATLDDGTATLDIVVPLETTTLQGSAVATVGGETATAQSQVSPGASPQLDQTRLLTVHTARLAQAIRSATAVFVQPQGDSATDAVLTQHLQAAGITVRPGPPSPPVQGEKQVVIVTGGNKLNLFQVHDRTELGMFPIALSDHVPGNQNAFLGLAEAPELFHQDMMVALASDDVGRKLLGEAVDALMKNQALPAPTVLITASAPISPPPKTTAPDTALDRFRAATMAEELLDPTAVWTERVKPSVARIGSLALAPDGKTLYAGALNWVTNLFGVDPATGGAKWTNHAGQGYVPHVWATKDGVAARISTVDDASHQVELFDSGGKALRRLAAPGVAVAPDGQFVDFTHEPFGWSFAVSPDGSIVAGSANVGVAAWDASSGRELWHKDTIYPITEINCQPAERLAISPDGKMIAIFSCEDAQGETVSHGKPYRYDPRLDVCDLASGKVLWSYQPGTFDHLVAVTPMWSSDSKRIVIGHEDGAGELENGKVTRQFDLWPGSYRPNSLELFDGKTLLGNDNQPLWTLDLAGRPVSWAWSNDGKTVAVSTDLGELEMHNADGSLLWRTQTRGAAALVMGAGELYAGDWAGYLYGFDAATGHQQWISDLGEARIDANQPDSSATLAPPFLPIGYWPTIQDPARPLGQNVALKAQGASIKLCDRPGWGFHGAVQIDPDTLIGQGTPDETKPWQNPGESWVSLNFNVPPEAEITLPHPISVTGIVIHESSQHPDSYPRVVFVDARVQGTWKRVWQGLVNPAAVHNHPFAEPVMADAIRYTPAACTLGGVYTTGIEVLAP